MDTVDTVRNISDEEYEELSAIARERGYPSPSSPEHDAFIDGAVWARRNS